MGHLGTSLLMFPRIIREIERQVTSYITQRVEQKIRKHMRKIGRQTMKQRSLSSLKTIGNLLARIGEPAQRQITRQVRRIIWDYHDPSNPLHTGVDQSMNISDFCKLELVGQIIMIECFQGADHEFILVHAKGLYENTPSDQLVWIRLEKGVKGEDRNVRYFQTMFRRTIPAYNTATISYHPKSITPADASPIKGNTLVFNGLGIPVTLKHLVALMRMMDEATSGYNPLKDTCPVFCQAIIDCMEPYQSKAIRVRHPDIDVERRRDLKRRFTSSIKDLHSYGFTPDS
ncbi:unnamed protein product [Rhizoctonia solani]|uniref:Uncharacterized protein n=1 Tax=Rhizoctonia solani TaxID=456999 RepID=A0A8H3C9J8_9AGAM|nr:unnamed protein product [Rhizoctonia solani]